MNPSFNSILWSQIRSSGNRSAFFSSKTSRNFRDNLLVFVLSTECLSSSHHEFDEEVEK